MYQKRTTSLKVHSYLYLIIFLLFFNFTALAQKGTDSDQDGDWGVNATWGSNDGETAPSYNLDGNDAVDIGGDSVYSNNSISVKGKASLSLTNCGTLVIGSGASLTGDGNISICDCCTLKVEGDLDLGGNGDLQIGGHLDVGGDLIASDCDAISGDGTVEVDSSNDCPGVLPVVLTQFKVSNQQGQALIQWTTATERNCDYFVVLRSSNGNHFEPIAEKKGQGNSLQPTNYKVTDPNPLSGTSYYRLKQVDFDGTSHLYNTKAFQLKSSTTPNINLYPNPSNKNKVNLRANGIEQDKVLVTLYNKMGQLVFSKVKFVQNGTIHAAIDPSEKLPPGIYFVIGSSDNRLFKEKLVIQ